MVTSPLTPDKVQSLYVSDYLAWTEATLGQLSRKDYDNVDWENLIEELSGMARSEKRGLKSNLIVVLLHLLKWQYQPALRSGSWSGSVVEHRGRVQDAIADSPSLKQSLPEIYDSAYVRAVKQAAKETGLAESTFPAICPYEIAQALDDDFFPE